MTGRCAECDGPPPARLREAAAQFNRGEFWECHETLEELWRPEQGRLKNFYRGLIQVAAGFVHVGRGNHRGCVRLIDTGTAFLEPYGPVCLGVDLALLLPAARRCREVALELGRERFGDFPRDIIPTIHLTAA